MCNAILPINNKSYNLSLDRLYMYVSLMDYAYLRTAMKRFLLSQLYGGSRRSSRYGNANVYPGQATFPREQQLRHRHTSMSSTKVFSAVGFNDYDAGVRDFKIEVPEHFNFSTDVIDSWAKLDVGTCKCGYI